VDGSGVRVAVVDTGVDVEHPDLADAVAELRSVVPLSPTGTDFSGHGTHVAGIIAGRGMVDERFRGIAPGASLLVFKAFELHGRGYSDDAAKAILDAVEAGVDIINYSASFEPPQGPPPWKWPRTPRDVLSRAVHYALQKGVLVVAAAGNQGPRPGSVGRPAVLSGVLSVGSLDWDGVVGGASARGPVYLEPNLREPARYDSVTDAKSCIQESKPDLVVPGGRLPALVGPVRMRGYPLGIVAPRSRSASALEGTDPTDPGSPYARMAGTSQACAVATGLAALAFEHSRKEGLNLGPDPGRAIRALMMEAARPPKVGTRDDYGRGSLLWVNLRATIDDCVANEARRMAILEGLQLRVL
jgi:subtilisin family serine protease